MRDVDQIDWGVRDWSKLTFTVERLHARKLVVRIGGALRGAGLQHFIDGKINREDVDVVGEL